MTAPADTGPKPVVAVLGSGSWGTALAVHLARTGHRTILWGIETEELAVMARDRVNRRYLPGAALPDGVAIEPDLARAVDAVGMLFEKRMIPPMRPPLAAASTLLGGVVPT